MVLNLSLNPTKTTLPASALKPNTTTNSNTLDNNTPRSEQVGSYWVGGDNNVYTYDAATGDVISRGALIKDFGTGFDTNQISSDSYTKTDVPSWWTDPSSSTTGATGGGSQYPDYSAANSILRSNVGSLSDIYNSDIAKAAEAAKIAENERLSAYNAAQKSSQESGISNDETVLNARNAIGKNVRTSNDRVMSILGALGINGSARNAAMNTIANTGNKSLNESNYTYGKNKRNILQSWNDYMNSSENQKKQISDTEAYNKAQAAITRDTNKKSLLSQIVSNLIEMGQGGNTNSILDEINAANANISSASNVKKSYTGETPVYNAPSIGNILGNALPASFGVSSAVKGSGIAKSLAPRIVRVNNSEKEEK